jgi:hypothetical protein
MQCESLGSIDSGYFLSSSMQQGAGTICNKAKKFR